MTVLSNQVGTVDEIAYGAPLTVTRFWEVEEVPFLKLDVGRAESDARRAGDYGIRVGKAVPYKKGGSASMSFPVPTKSFAWWLKHMMGNLSTGAVVDSNYPHTATIGSLIGDFFTLQTGMAFNPSGTVSPFTGHGGKVKSWELSCDVDGLLEVSLDMDFEDVDTATALATASYPAATTVFSFVGAAMTIGGTSVEMKNVTVGLDNGLNTDRRFLRGNQLKKEPTTVSPPVVSWSGDAEFTDLNQYNRWAAATDTAAHAAIVMTFQGPFAHAGTTLPSLVVTIPEARFDDYDLSNSDGMMQSLSGNAQIPAGGGSAMTIVYTTTDVTP